MDIHISTSPPGRSILCTRYFFTLPNFIKISNLEIIYIEKIVDVLTEIATTTLSGSS